MKILVTVALLVLLNACAIPESEQLRKENVDLKAQLETVTQERDALKLQIDSIRKALEAPAVVPDSGAPGESSSGEFSSGAPAVPNSSTPDSSTPDSSTPDSVTPDAGAVPPEVAPINPGSSNDSGITPAPSEQVPETPTPEQPVTPQSTAPVMPNPEMGGAAVTTSPLYKYANEVVQAATNYRVQTQQVPPPDCSLGYSAGQNKVERSTQVKRCEVQPLKNNQFRVRLESIDGSVVIAP
jgi:hypothetical protein